MRKSLFTLVGLWLLIASSTSAQTSFETDNFFTEEMGFQYFESFRLYTASTTGDFNGDGIDDLIFGGRDNVYIIYGDADRENTNLRSGDLDGQLGVKISGIYNDADEGIELASGDLNNDGFDDLFIGLKGGASLDSGLLHVIFGTNAALSSPFDVSTLDGTTGFTVEGNSSSDNFAADITTGDVNGDQIDDLLLINDQGEQIIGILGSSDGIEETLITSAFGSDPNYSRIVRFDVEYAGTATESKIETGDLNGDGIDDIIYANPEFQNDAGEVVVFYGMAENRTQDFSRGELTATDGFKISGSGSDEFLGFSLAANDLNSDGFDELIIGAPLTDYKDNNTSGEEFGIIYVLPGININREVEISTDTLSNLGAFTIVSDREDFQEFEIGRTVATGDVNDDGFDDLVIGSGTSGGRSLGNSYVVLGAADLPEDEISLLNLSSEQGFIIYGERDRFDNAAGMGGSLVATGDYNNDGFADLVISGNLDYERETLYVFDNLAGITVNNQFENDIVSTFNLEQNYPNPFNPSTTINFSVQQAGNVTMRVYNLLGQQVATLVDQKMQAGSHSVTFDASALSSGTYIYRLTSGDFVQTKKMMLIK
jgi:hypothetical protein